MTIPNDWYAASAAEIRAALLAALESQERLANGSTIGEFVSGVLKSSMGISGRSFRPGIFGRAIIDGADADTPIAVSGIAPEDEVTFVLEFSAQGFGFDALIDRTGDVVVAQDAVSFPMSTVNSRILVFWINRSGS